MSSKLFFDDTIHDRSQRNLPSRRPLPVTTIFMLITPVRSVLIFTLLLSNIAGGSPAYHTPLAAMPERINTQNATIHMSQNM